ncbi:glutaredoxin family protein [Cyanobium sp. FGCU-52]|nr:glutaredoxin family protein [Cyanobium sp. FGCU52]
MHRPRKRWLLPPMLAMLLGLLLALTPSLAAAQPGVGGAELQVFVRDGCPHCAAAKSFLPELQRLRPGIQVRLRPLESDPTAIDDLLRYSRQAGIQAPGVPTFVLEGQVLVGFDDAKGRGRQLLDLIDRGERASGNVSLGRLGSISATALGLPIFTLAMGLLDGFNPCAMWVLLFLLSLLVHWRDRRRMALVAGTFVFVSGAVYYAFMAAWLNVFLLLGFTGWLRLLLGSVAVVLGVVNLSEFWRTGPDFTLSIPASAKPGLYARMRGVMQSRSLPAALAAVAALAVVVNAVELLCTAGLPAVYTAVLSQQNLAMAAHYGYLGLYIVGYIADDALMVGLAVLALSSSRLSEGTGRWLKLISGAVMMALGLLLLLRPGWLL